MSRIVDITQNLTGSVEEKKLTIDDFKAIVLADYRVATESRQASLTGRKEVLTGKAKFGIFGDGKELAQIAMAKAFDKGDWRSGYYRDQTFMMALGVLSLEEFFAQLYANPDVTLEPHSAGRQMNAHFATRLINEDGSWKNQLEQYNTSADMSPTAGQMPRLLGLALASKVYRNDNNLPADNFSNKGNEVAFGTIGDASTSEGLFWETMNAATVLQVPLAMSVWDDGYGISVAKKYQTAKQSISTALRGMERDENNDGLIIYNVKGWDYAALCETYEKGVAICREKHIPVLFHVEELTQPQGHSTSGSHERYKNEERLNFEKEYDCNVQFKQWIIENAIATAEELDAIEAEAKERVKQARKNAWDAFLNPIKQQVADAAAILTEIAESSAQKEEIEKLKHTVTHIPDPARHNVIEALKKALWLVRSENETPAIAKAKAYLKGKLEEGTKLYDTYTYGDTALSPLNIKAVQPVYDADAKPVDGREILRDNYDAILASIPEFLIFGEDAGKIGGVNQTLEGMQAKYGEQRVGDTGIREATIVGQGIGMALRGLRPVAEIQYLDYLLYAVQTLSDDLASLTYRTAGGQRAPLIISTRGHRLEGVWHSGSPLGMMINSLRGMHICVPRNMTQAAGFYNTLLAGDEPGIVIEPLNGYRIKEQRPTNMGEFRTPLGVPEVLKQGTDVTVVTYGSCIRIAQKAIEDLEKQGISVELIDVQTLLPFDLTGIIVESLKKTNRVVFMDEDVPGGASAYMLQQVLETQNGYRYLDAKPVTLTGKQHRPSFGSDGDYFSKPSAEDVFDAVYGLMSEAKPGQFKPLY